MLDHVSIQVSDLEASGAFYDAVLEPLGYSRVPPFGREIGFGVTGGPHWSRGRSLVQFSIGPAVNIDQARETHIAFVADNRDQVLAFHDAAVAVGAELLHGPRLFGEYHAHYFAAFIRDPDGNNVEAVCHAQPGAQSGINAGLNLNNVLVGSVDPELLAQFYERVFGEATFRAGRWLAWEVGDGFLTLGPHGEVTGDTERPGPVLIGFFTEDVETAFARIKQAGAGVVRAPFHPVDDPEGWLAFLADPDGNCFQIMSPTRGPGTDKPAG